jgi:hypothetical protein
VFIRQNADWAEFIKEMALFNISRDEAGNLREDRWSWCAIPLEGKAGSVIAVVYFDSSDKLFFDEKTQELAIAACAGIASYVQERYNA